MDTASPQSKPFLSLLPFVFFFSNFALSSSDIVCPLSCKSLKTNSWDKYTSLFPRTRCRRRRCVDAVVVDVGWRRHQIHAGAFPDKLARRTSSGSPRSRMPAPPPFPIPRTTPHSFSSIFKRYLFREKTRENQHHMRWVTATGCGGGGRGVHSMMARVHYYGRLRRRRRRQQQQ